MNAKNERLPLTRIRKATAKAMSASAAVPQFTIEREVAAAPMLDLRMRIQEEGGSAGLSDFLTAACARALRNHRDVNASFDGEGIVRHADINVANAIALDQGLVAPCTIRADAFGLEELAIERKRLADSARAGTLAPIEQLNSTFTISNLGPFGIRRFQALVTPPQAAILAVGAVAPGIVVGPQGMELDSILTLTLSCDHRVLDGAPASEFLSEVVAGLSTPEWMLDL